MPRSSSSVIGAAAAGFALAGVAGVAAVAAAAYLSDPSFRLPWEKESTPEPLTLAEWNAAFDENGRATVDHVNAIIEKIRAGGIPADLREQVWPFLLQLRLPNQSFREQTVQRKLRWDKYRKLKRLAEELSAAVCAQESRPQILGGGADAGGGHGVTDASEGEASSAGEDMLSSSEGGEPSSPLGRRTRRSDLGPLTSALPAGDVDGRHMVFDGDAWDAPPVPGALEEWRGGGDAGAGGAAGIRALSEGAALRQRFFGAEQLRAFGGVQRIIWLDAIRTDPDVDLPDLPVSTPSWRDAENWLMHPEAVPRSVADILARMREIKLSPRRRVHAVRIAHILQAYALHDPEIGYCQGMSDLCSPFVAVMSDDAEAFWCFAKFMQRMRNNFHLEEDKQGIYRQLKAIAAIVAAADPRLDEHLGQIGAGDYHLYAYRMVVVLLRRELNFNQTLTLWEILWADSFAASYSEAHPVAAAAAAAAAAFQDAVSASVQRVVSGQPPPAPPSQELGLFVIAAVILSMREEFVERCTGPDDVLKVCHAVAGHLDIWKMLRIARKLVVKLKGTPIIL
eukprot:jgi/Mesvir1/5245/Mv15366-RA.1